jgi:uncharacterized protein DUF1501
MLHHSHTAGLTRREVLQVGYSGLLALSLPAVLAGRTRAAAGDSLGKSKRSLVVVYLTGAPSHIDTFDLKPDAPLEVRGEFKPIATAAPGIQICEHLPRLAARAGQWAVVRSLAHTENNHLLASHHVLTGASLTGGKPDQIASRQDWPCYAAGFDYLRPRADGIPTGVTLPNHLVEGPLTWPGQHAGFLGARHDPWQLNQDPNAANFRVDSVQLPSAFTIERLAERRVLLDQVNRQRAALDRYANDHPLPGQQEQAFTILTSGKVAQAFDLEREPAATRDRYGRHRLGQSLLLARRLVQAGVPVVQVNMGIVQTWDTHTENFSRLKSSLLPPLDQGVAALLDDLSALGLLDETLVMMLGEFGRTPKISTMPGAKSAGRDHWAPCFFGVFAGAGVRGAQVIGKSDKIGAFPITTPFTPNDIGATVYDALGIDPGVEVHDRQGRPVRLNSGHVIRALWT